jgi:hypothetical protein
MNGFIPLIGNYIHLDRDQNLNRFICPIVGVRDALGLVFHLSLGFVRGSTSHIGKQK